MQTRHGTRTSTGGRRGGPPRPAGLALCLVVALSPAACRQSPDGPGAATEPVSRTEEICTGTIQVQAIASPARVALDKDLLLTLRITAPSRVRVEIPPLDDRLSGFILNGVLEREPRTEGDSVILERCLRLHPGVAAEYRLRPIALQIDDPAAPGQEPRWAVTRPLVFEPAPLLQDRSKARVGSLVGPVRIYPGWKSFLLWGLLLFPAAGLAVLLWFLARKIRREVQLRRMSPRERALHELHLLAARDLVGHGQVKEFYFELTMIVRRYIERAHAIRAPEQTTEEFLAAASRDPRFSAETIMHLRLFLQAADLVKYAAHRPDPPTVDQAMNTARNYVERDSPPTASPVPVAPAATPPPEPRPPLSGGT